MSSYLGTSMLNLLSTNHIKMKLKTVKKVLESKIQKWIDSVDDKIVKEAIRDGAIVTGGSIASLLLKEEVNDFDIYFKTQETLRTVCEYYCKPLDVEVIDGVKAKKEWETLQGNIEFSFLDENQSRRATFLKNMDPERIKLFTGALGHKKIDPLELKKDKDGNSLPYQVSFISPNAISLTDKVQIVARFWGEAAEIHKNYDFVHATNYYDVKERELVLHNKALISLLTRELSYIGSLYPLTSVIRAKKFIGRKWTITAGTYLKILYQVSLLDLNDIKELEEQLIGVDIAYFAKLIAILKTVQDKDENFIISYDWLADMIDKVFDGDDEDEETGGTND